MTVTDDRPTTDNTPLEFVVGRMIDVYVNQRLVVKVERVGSGGRVELGRRTDGRGTEMMMGVGRVKRVEELGLPASLEKLAWTTYVARSTASAVYLESRGRGGKGGFGQLIRKGDTEGRVVKPTTNFSACRTLDGRRLRQVELEAHLAAVQEGGVSSALASSVVGEGGKDVVREVEREKGEAQKRREERAEERAQHVGRVAREVEETAKAVKDAVRVAVKRKEREGGEEGGEGRRVEKKRKGLDGGVAYLGLDLSSSDDEGDEEGVVEEEEGGGEGGEVGKGKEELE